MTHTVNGCDRNTSARVFRARDCLMGGYAVTSEERARIAELLRQQNRAPYRAIARTLGRSVQPVFEIAAALVDAGEIPLPRIGRPKRGNG